MFCVALYCFALSHQNTFQTNTVLFDLDVDVGDDVVHICVMEGADTLSERELCGTNGRWLAVGYAGWYNNGNDGTTFGNVLPVRRIVGNDAYLGKSRTFEYYARYYVTRATDLPSPPKQDMPATQGHCQHCGGPPQQGRKFLANIQSSDDSGTSGANESDADRTATYEELMDCVGNTDTAYGGKAWGGEGVHLESNFPESFDFSNGDTISG